jgi:hypothetical protein
VADLFPTLLAVAELEAPPTDGRVLSRTRVAGRERPFVLVEEHVSRSHNPPESKRIAEHIYGIQRAFSQRIVWEHGQSCRRRRGERWPETPCPPSLEQAHARLRDLLGSPLFPVAAPPDGELLLEEEREALEALGYL